MQLHHAFIFGIVEGISEFLPISSTFHLLLTAKTLGIPQNDFVKLFEVVIQSGAILALTGKFFDILKKNPTYRNHIFFALLPTLGVGFVLYKVIKGFFFENLLLTSIVFVIVGFVMLVIDKIKTKKDNTLSLNDLSSKQSFLIGLFQALAVVPGVSRSGSVLIGMKLLGYKYEHSAIFTFLIGFPTIIFATLFDLTKNITLLLSLSASLYLSLLVGIVVSGITAYLVLDWFLRYLQTHNLFYFGLYRILFGVIILYNLLAK